MIGCVRPALKLVGFGMFHGSTLSSWEITSRPASKQYEHDIRYANLATRKSHRKSRTGCETCKHRHVKCDEQLPACGQCSRRKLTCQYHHATSSVHEHPEFPRTANLQSIVSQDQSGIGPDDPASRRLSDNLNFTLLDLELLHFYTTQSYKSIRLLHDIPDELWRDQVPKVAFQNPVLMHAILCFSATHLKHINPASQVYDGAITFHKHHALSLLRQKLDSLTEPSSPMNEAVYGTGVILALQSVATFKSHSNSYPTDLDWIPLISGFKSLVINMWEGCRESIFYPLITTYRDPEPRTAEDQQKALNKFNLAQLLAQLPPSYSEHVIRLACIMDPFFPHEYYDSPLASCASMSRSGYERTPGFETMRQLFGWIARLPDSFMSRAREHDPSVLVLLGWVFSLFRQIYSHNPIWWIERISQDGVEDIDKVAKFSII